MNKRKIFTLAMAVMMIAILAVGGSLAFLTDTDHQVNTFTSGNVDIEQYEKDRNGNEYVDNKKLFPVVDNTKNADGYYDGKNYVDKIVTVENTGSEDAYVRTFLAVPASIDDGPTTFDANMNVMHWKYASASDTSKAATSPRGDNDWYWTAEHNWANDWVDGSNGATWDGYQMTKDGILYNVYIATHKAAIVPDEVTAPTLLGVYFDASLDYDNETKTYFIVKNGVRKDVVIPQNEKGEYTWDVLVFSQAVQAEGFVDAYDALAHAFGNPGVAATNKIAAFACPFGGTGVTAFKDVK